MLPAAKTTSIITIPLGLIIVLPVCCFTILFQELTTTGVSPAILYQAKDSDDYNIGLVGLGISLLNVGSRHFRRSSSFRNNNIDFDFYSKKAINIT